MKEKALLLIAYNRPDLLTKQIIQIKKINILDGYDILLFVDGPKNAHDLALQKEISNVINNDKSLFTNVKINKINVGLKANVKNSILYVSENYKKFIVLEDDISINLSSINYADKYLDLYESDDSVYHINMWNHQFVNVTDNYLSKEMHCWGWASWSRCWNEKIFEIEEYKNISLIEKIKLSRIFSTPHYLHLYSNLNKKRETWAVLWMTHIIKNNKNCISPSSSLSYNLGINSGTHLDNVIIQKNISNEENNICSIKESRYICYKTWFLNIVYTKKSLLLKNLFYVFFK